MRGAALTASQLAVVRAPPDVSIAVTAVAGAGKTRVVIERALELIGRGTQPRRLLFLSFSKDAREELRTRLQQHQSTRGCQTSTIHALAMQQLNASLLNDRVIRAIEQSMPVRPGRKPGEVASVLGRKAEGLTPAEQRVLQEFDSARQVANQRDGKTYLTYAEMLDHVVRLWQDDPAALNRIRNSFDYLFVDEYQDISAPLHLVITTLAGAKPTVVAGDPHQAIFGFQGGDPRFLAEMVEKAQLRFTLDECHRAPAQHVLLAGSFLPPGAAFVPMKGFDGTLTIREVPDGYSPQDVLIMTLEAIRRRSDADWSGFQAKPRQCAIILHSNSEINELRGELLAHGFDVSKNVSRTRGDEDPFVERYFRMCLSTLAGTRDRPLPLLKHPWPPIAPNDRALLDAGWRTERCPSILARYCQSEGARHLLEVWLQLLEASRRPVRTLPGSVSQLFGLASPRLAAADKLCRGKTNVREVLAALNYDAPAVDSEFLITTIHKAKGREWGNVIVYDGQDWGGGSGRVSAEEAGRLAYVALTRSTEHLTVIIGPGGHGMFRHPRGAQIVGLQTLSAAHAEHADFSTLALEYGDLPGLRRWIGDSAVKHLPKKAYFRVLGALQSVKDPPALPANWSEPPSLPPRVVRIPLTQKAVEHGAGEAEAADPGSRWAQEDPSS